MNAKIKLSFSMLRQQFYVISGVALKIKSVVLLAALPAIRWDALDFFERFVCRQNMDFTKFYERQYNVKRG